jgi:hypothetical protein
MPRSAASGLSFWDVHFHRPGLAGRSPNGDAVIYNDLVDSDLVALCEPVPVVSNALHC